ncbi:hypothetical protein OTB20_14995 [Streptomyces sp. H27-H1]|uniref:hypothetical protein n=1 Tax=Streptomyces sp. H27-H1 TaxID=2996461 RepID=UPI002270F6AD|nr:hypothetical protein [Streptomyces sp. H27-H1]MCY0927493.1 hypothetical protein [Streptomyces sp. H27-H1]
MTEQSITGAEPAPVEDAAFPQAAVAKDTVPAPTLVPESSVPSVSSENPANAYGSPAVPAAPEAPVAPKDRRKLLAALRWTAAVLVFGAVGAGVAYEVTEPERTDIPGLSTKADGRWTYPAPTRPALPAGAALPFAEDNPDGIHYAGLTELLLPAPTGSAPDSELKLEKDGVVAVDTFLAEYEAAEREKMKEQFTNEGLRQIAARGWTTPDGTRTRVYLLRFHASGFVDTFNGCGPTMKLKDVRLMGSDLDWSKGKSGQSAPPLNFVSLFAESKPVGDEQVKAGCVQSGDIQAVILQTREGEVATVPFHQTVILQHQLLG